MDGFIPDSDAIPQVKSEFMPELQMPFAITGQMQTAFHLTVALLLGALIGLQRGWEARDKQAGERIAGLRTHALVGLTGGIATLLAQAVTLWLLPTMLLVVAGLAISAYYARSVVTHDYSITGIIGLLLTFSFGALATAGEVVPAAMAAVITTMILDNKQEIHGALKKLQAYELDAALKLLVISVVVLPLLPRQGFGPGQALNPYEIWWMVVLIASISFVGYFAVRIAGPKKGILFTSLFAGLSSSTALTLHFARISRNQNQLSSLLAAGILLACGTMLPRILLYCLIISPSLLGMLVLPLLVMTLVLYLPALLIGYRDRSANISQPELSKNPLDLKSALILGGLLVIILLLAEWLQVWLGDAGIYLLAAVSGLTDVDAITLSLTRLNVAETIDPSVAVTGIVIAASVNNLFKAGLAVAIGKHGLGRKVAVPMVLSPIAGLLCIWLMA